MEKQRRERVKRIEKMREMRDRGERVRDKFFFFFLQYCYSAILSLELHCSSIAKNLQYLPLQFFDVDDFKAANAKFPLDMALAFFNANALSICCEIVLNYGDE